jgi:ring-1,2-phenylacetyl-CoA epoxidase subunit PaaC
MAATLSAPGELDDRERAAVRELLFALADDEFVLADRYTEWQCQGPTLEADVAVANVAQDELGHARLWYDLLQDFGPTESELIWERDPEAFRHSTLVERPFATGEWGDAVVRSYFYDVAEDLRLEALEGTSYPRIADRVGKVRGEEHYHREHAQNWLERLCEDEAGRSRVQAAVDDLFPHALTLFVPTDREADIVDLGIRPTPIEQLRDDWLTIVGTFLDGLGVDLPMAPDDDPDDYLPAAVGRDGSHTDAWFRQFNALTYTYRMLDREEATRLMPDPDDV